MARVRFLNKSAPERVRALFFVFVNNADRRVEATTNGHRRAYSHYSELNSIAFAKAIAIAFLRSFVVAIRRSVCIVLYFQYS